MMLDGSSFLKPKCRGDSKNVAMKSDVEIQILNVPQKCIWETFAFLKI